jgi:hypothetical protein
MRYTNFLNDSSSRKLLVLREVFLGGQRQAELVKLGFTKSTVSLDKRFIEERLGELQAAIEPEDIRFVVDEFERMLHELLDD